MIGGTAAPSSTSTSCRRGGSFGAEGGSSWADFFSAGGLGVRTEGDADAARNCSSRLGPTTLVGELSDGTGNDGFTGDGKGNEKGRGVMCGSVASLKRRPLGAIVSGMRHTGRENMYWMLARKFGTEKKCARILT